MESSTEPSRRSEQELREEKEMPDINSFLGSLWGVLQYVGVVVGLFGLAYFIKSGKDRDQEKRDDALWGMAGGFTLALISTVLNGMTFPTF